MIAMMKVVIYSTIKFNLIRLFSRVRLWLRLTLMYGPRAIDTRFVLSRSREVR